MTEATYKLTDMLVSGNGAPIKLPKFAYKILSSMYENLLLPEFKRGNYECELADVAIRIGNIHLENAESDAASSLLAYQYYLIGKYALELRNEKREHFGDKSVLKRLIPKLEKAKEIFRSRCSTDNQSLEEMLEIVVFFTAAANPSVNIKNSKMGGYNIKLVAPALKCWNERELIAVPKLDYCKLIGKIKLHCFAEPVVNSNEKIEYVNYAYMKNGMLNLCDFEEMEDGQEYKRVLVSIPLEGLELLEIK